MEKLVANGLNGIHNEKGNCVALTYGVDREKNSKEIVKRVNMHEELVKRLSELLIRADERDTLTKNSAMSEAKQLLRQLEQQ